MSTVSWIFVGLLVIFSYYEITAPSSSCLRNEFKCANDSTCLRVFWRCHGGPNCTDSSDEIGCDTRLCPASDYRCGSGRCLPRLYVCDGSKDCPDGSDEEKNCVPSPVCLRNQFRCSDGSRCIPMINFCDGGADCFDGSDESRCADEDLCSEGSHRCAVGGRCEPMASVCDGHPDCPSGTDEDNCDKCENLGCSQLCRNTAEGRSECYCQDGFELDVKDSRTCRIIGREDSDIIFFNEGTKLYVKIRNKAGLNSTQLLPTPALVTRINALSFDLKRLNLFIADANRPAIVLVDLSTYAARDLVTDSMNSPVDLAIDLKTNELYWVDSEKGTLEAISVNTLERRVVVRDLSNPLALALSPSISTIFIATDGVKSSIFVYGTDGIYGRSLVSGQGSPASLALHPTKTLLYWTVPEFGEIFFADYSKIRSTSRILKRNMNGVMSVTVTERDIYFTSGELVTSESVHWIKNLGWQKYEGWKSITSGVKYSDQD